MHTRQRLADRSVPGKDEKKINLGLRLQYGISIGCNFLQSLQSQA